MDASFAYTCETCVFPSTTAHDQYDARSYQGHQRRLRSRMAISWWPIPLRSLRKALAYPPRHAEENRRAPERELRRASTPIFGKRRASLVGNSHGAVLWRSHLGYMLCTLDGITINENFQAVDDNGKAIEGLYRHGRRLGFVLCPHVSEYVDRQLLRPFRHLRPHDRKDLAAK